MKRIIQMVRSLKEKPLQDWGIFRGLVGYINMCCNLLFDDGWTSYSVKLIVVELADDLLRFTYTCRTE